MLYVYNFQFATFDTNTDLTYHGASALINLYNPPVTGDQYSMAQFWLQSGPALELNSIQAGWAVSHILFYFIFTILVNKFLHVFMVFVYHITIIYT